MKHEKEQPVADSSTNVGSTGNNYANKDEKNSGKSYSAKRVDLDKRIQELKNVKYLRSQPKSASAHSNGVVSFQKKVICGVCIGFLTGITAAVTFLGVLKYSGRFQVLTQETIKEVEQSSARKGDGEGKAETVERTNYSNTTDVVKEAMPFMVSIINLHTSENIKEQLAGESSESSGSGIIIGNSSKELLIATNYHVIANADKIAVTFIDDSKASAKRKGIDPEMDLAVIAIPFNELRDSTIDNIAVAPLGNSDGLEIGENVIAIGNALGYGQSVTTGVISALNREVNISAISERTGKGTAAGTFIQTDAAINPGNSGGALLNSAGEVIGINTSKIQGGMIEGMGYAIPISAAEPIIENLMTKESRDWDLNSDKGFLGIAGKGVTEEANSTYGMPLGIYISNVMADGAAADAGIKNGDIIVSIDGTKVRSMDSLKNIIAYYKAGDELELGIERISSSGYVRETVSVTLKRIG